MASATEKSLLILALSFVSGFLYGCSPETGFMGESVSLCAFDDNDESVPQNNQCTSWTFTEGSDGNVALRHQGDGKCIFSASQSCGGDIIMADLERMELDVAVSGCASQAWMSVYMFERLNWHVNQEYDFMETGTGVNPTGPASNFAGTNHQVSWGLSTEDGFERHVTLKVLSYEDLYMEVEILQCEVGSATCVESLTEAARWQGVPPKGKMQIVVDHWGWDANNHEAMGAGNEGCELSVSNMHVVRK